MRPYAAPHPQRDTQLLTIAPGWGGTNAHGHRGGSQIEVEIAKIPEFVV